MVRLIRPFGASAAAVVLALFVTLSPTVAIAASPWLLGLPNLLPPIGTADSYSTPYETELVVDPPGVLANDIDLDSPVLTTRLVSGPANGTLILELNGHFHYQPDPGFHGLDSFTYRPFDGTFEALLPATVSITVAKPVPTPTPRPTPTPTPRPTPTPTPTPTRTPTPTPTPTPFPIPTPTLPPLPTPTLPPLPIPTPTLPPLPIPTPTPPPVPIPTPTPTPPPVPIPTPPPVPPSASPGSTAGPSGAPVPSPDPSSRPGLSPDPSGQPGVGGVVTGGGGPTTPSGSDPQPLVPLLEPQAGPVSFGSFGDVGMGIEWIVPGVLITVPGFLLIVIGLAQLFGGFVWLPLARRWMRGDGRRPAVVAKRLPN